MVFPIELRASDKPNPTMVPWIVVHRDDRRQRMRGYNHCAHIGTCHTAPLDDAMIIIDYDTEMLRHDSSIGESQCAERVHPHTKSKGH